MCEFCLVTILSRYAKLRVEKRMEVANMNKIIDSKAEAGASVSRLLYRREYPKIDEMSRSVSRKREYAASMGMLFAE